MGHHRRMSPAHAVQLTPGYRGVVTISAPIMRWSRLTVIGVESLPTSGPTLLIANHDSYWDPIAIAVAARQRRQIQALAKSTIWKLRPVGWLMDSMGQIPIDRGTANDAAIDMATKALAAGACIGVFPEGTRSLGAPLRARSGAGRLALAVPGTTIVCARVTGTTDVVRLPKRPRINVEFFRPVGGGARPGESAGELMTRLVAEVRDGAPYTVPGRRRTAAKLAKRASDATTMKD
jgi:1-acyl-sn-glycerol-3-phosphate acyltransferase